MDFSGTGTRVVTDRQIALPGSVAAIGAFDGVHRGHQHLIRAAIRDARARGVPSVVWTFDPPPKVFFGRARQLVALDQKLARIGLLGPDWIVVAPFHAAYARRSAEAFLADLGRIAPRRIHVGADFRFGARQSGDVALLARHFDLALARPVCCTGGQTISSSLTVSETSSTAKRRSAHAGRPTDRPSIDSRGAPLIRAAARCAG